MSQDNPTHAPGAVGRTPAPEHGRSSGRRWCFLAPCRGIRSGSWAFHGVPRGRRDEADDRTAGGSEQVRRLINGAFSARRVIDGRGRHPRDAGRGPDGPPVGIACRPRIAGWDRPAPLRGDRRGGQAGPGRRRRLGESRDPRRGDQRDLLHAHGWRPSVATEAEQMPLAADEEALPRRGRRGVDSFAQIVGRQHLQFGGVVEHGDRAAPVGEVDMSPRRDR